MPGEINEEEVGVLALLPSPLQDGAERVNQVHGAAARLKAALVVSREGGEAAQEEAREDIVRQAQQDDLSAVVSAQRQVALLREGHDHGLPPLIRHAAHLHDAHDEGAEVLGDWLAAVMRGAETSSIPGADFARMLPMREPHSRRNSPIFGKNGQKSNF